MHFGKNRNLGKSDNTSEFVISFNFRDIPKKFRMIGSHAKTEKKNEGDRDNCRDWKREGGDRNNCRDWKREEEGDRNNCRDWKREGDLEWEKEKRITIYRCWVSEKQPKWRETDLRQTGSTTKRGREINRKTHKRGWPWMPFPGAGVWRTWGWCWGWCSWCWTISVACWSQFAPVPGTADEQSGWETHQNDFFLTRTQ